MRSATLFLAGLVSVLTAGWTVFPRALYKSSPQPLQFNHKVHAEKAGSECSSCHEIRADGSFSGIPGIANCAGCHPEPQGTSLAEKTLVEKYVKPNVEIPWHGYYRQPINARFSHVRHVKAGKLKCETCHGDHGKSSSLPPYEENRISGYSRRIWGAKILRVNIRPDEGMKMSDCENCHAQRGVSAGCLGCHQ